MTSHEAERRECRSCHRPLTDPVSRAYGRGPVCRGDSKTPAPRSAPPAPRHGPVEVDPGQLAIPIQLELT